jgi:hypothetical protein
MKGSTKIIVVILLVALAGLLMAHWIILRNVSKEFTAKETALVNQVTDLNLQLENKTMENQVLNTKLAIEGIRIEVLRNNFGTAGEAIDDLRSMLIEGGCTKMEQLYPVFEAFKVDLLKKQGADALTSLEQVKSILFEQQPGAGEEKAEGN